MVIAKTHQQVTVCFEVSEQPGWVNQSAVVVRSLRVLFYVVLRHVRFCQLRICTYCGVGRDIADIVSTCPSYPKLSKNLST